MRSTVQTPHLAAAAYLILLGYKPEGFEAHPYKPGTVRVLFPKNARPDLDVWYETVDKLRASLTSSPRSAT